MKRALLLAAQVALLSATTGCATYWQYRADDLAEIADLGVTVTDDMRFAFYHSFESIITLGWSDFEGTFHGLGNGEFGRHELYLRGWGLLVYGDEEIGWDAYDKADRSTLYTQNTGIVGVPVGFVTGNSNPHYVPT